MIAMFTMGVIFALVVVWSFGGFDDWLP